MGEYLDTSDSHQESQDLTIAEDNGDAEETSKAWQDLANSYKQCLYRQLDEIRNVDGPRPVLASLTVTQQDSDAQRSVTHVLLKDIEISRRKDTNEPKALKNIVLSFKPAGQKELRNVHVGIDIFTFKEEIRVRLFLYKLVDADRTKLRYNNSVVLKSDGDNARWRTDGKLLTWTTKGADLQMYARRWYARDQTPANMKLEGPLEGLDMSLNTDSIFSVQTRRTLDIPDSLSIVDNRHEHLETVVGWHVRALLARALDWVVFATFSNEVIEISGDNELPVAEGANGARIAESLGLTSSENYKPTRAVDISPFDLAIACEASGLQFPWNVYQSVCASMNLQRHLILTGPPGCGKTELASHLARLIGEKNDLSAAKAEPKVVTASPAWTSGDVIGRYFPRPDNRGLAFQPGVFLQALQEGRCLVIDEMNRANLDECFGELFTVLAGQSVDLPYEAVMEEDEQAIEVEGSTKSSVAMGVVRIVPRRGAETVLSNRVIYEMGQTFRLIGTMNDADRSSLHALSFALLRRFDVVRVDPPSTKVLQSLLATSIEKDIKEPLYTFKHIPKDSLKTAREQAKAIVTAVFCPERPTRPLNVTSDSEEWASSTESEVPNTGLIPEYIVGVATMLDVVRFVGEGLRPAASETKDGKKSTVTFEGKDKTEAGLRSFVTSLVTMGIVLTVVPQLDALEDDKFKETLHFLASALGDGRFLRLDQREKGEKELILIEENSDIGDSERKKTHRDILFEEVARSVRGTARLARVTEIQKKYSPVRRNHELKEL